MNDPIPCIAAKIAEEQAAYIDLNVKKLLRTYNLPENPEIIEQKGFKLIIEQHPNGIVKIFLTKIEKTAHIHFI